MGKPVGQSRERHSAGQLLDGLVAIVDLLDNPPPVPVAHSQLRVAG